MRNGILEDVIRMMQLNGNTLQDYEKLTILMFDEVKISSTMEYDVLRDEVVGSHSQMQVVWLEGSHHNGNNLSLLVLIRR